MWHQTGKPAAPPKSERGAVGTCARALLLGSWSRRMGSLPICAARAVEAADVLHQSGVLVDHRDRVVLWHDAARRRAGRRDSKVNEDGQQHMLPHIATRRRAACCHRRQIPPRLRLAARPLAPTPVIASEDLRLAMVLSSPTIRSATASPEGRGGWPAAGPSAWALWALCWSRRKTNFSREWTMPAPEVRQTPTLNGGAASTGSGAGLAGPNDHPRPPRRPSTCAPRSDTLRHWPSRAHHGAAAAASER